MIRRLLLATALLGACRSGATESDDVPTFTVAEAATFVRPVKAEGTLEAVEATPVLAPRDSERPMKIAWLAEDGTRVEEGEVIVRFDDTEALRLKEDSSDDLESAQQEIKKVRVTSEATQHKRTVNADLAQFETEVAREFETDNEDYFSRNEIIESTIDIDLAEEKYTHSKNLSSIEKSVSSHELDLHRIDKERAQREVERADEALSRLEVTAPHDGIVVLERNWRGEPTRVGDTVWRGQKIAELPHVAKMQAAVFVLEADAGSLAEGLPATMRIDAHPERAWEAKVLRVDTLAQPRHPEVPVHYFGVILELAVTDPEAMRVGQRVTAEIRIEKPDALVVPRQAIFEDDGQAVVYRASGSGFAKVAVELGLSSAGRVVISNGLAAGDVVALRDPDLSADEVLAEGEGDKSGKQAAPGGQG